MITATLTKEIRQLGVLYSLRNLVHYQHGSPQIDTGGPESWHLEHGGGETSGLKSVSSFQRIIVWFLAATSITSELLHLQLQTPFFWLPRAPLRSTDSHASIHIYLHT